jgi:hypothetical protein
MRNAAAVFLAFAISTTAQGQCPHSFAAAQLAAGPGGIVGQADFDGDRQLDAVTSSGEIQFGGGTRVVTLPRTGGRFITDVDRDGLPDVIGLSSNELFSLINRGDATFTIKTTPAVWSVASPDAHSADFNGDGRLDVFVPGVVAPLLASTPIYLAAGDGTFTPEYGTFIPANTKILTADVNGDGRDDLIYKTLNFIPTKTTIYLREQNGFALPRLLPEINGFLVSAGDFDGDRRDDLVFNIPTVSGTVATILLDPAGPARLGVTVPGSAVISPDFDGDGVADLVVSNPNGLQFHLNDGTGAVSPSDSLPGVFSVAGAADIDGDGVVDLVTSTGFVHGNGDGTFRVPRVPLTAANSGAAGDFDGDGDDDLAFPTAIAWNNGNNTFLLAPHGDLRLQRPLFAADTDGDAKAELMSRRGSAVFVLSLHPDGSIVERTNISARPIDTTIGDFTGTGHPEVAVIPDTLHSVEVYNSQRGIARVVVSTVGDAQGLGVADLNGDGRDDIVVVGRMFSNNAINGFLSVFISTGTSFQSERRIVFTANQMFDKVVTGDFDGDQKMDAVVTEIRLSDRLLFFQGDGSGTLTNTKQYVPSGGDIIRFMQTSDFDGDGRTDIAINGATSIFYGGATGLERRAAYFGPDTLSTSLTTYQPLVVRPRRDALPWLIVPTQYAGMAYMYRPLCDGARSRAVRHQ